jgi:poly(A) polymerase
VVDLNYLKKFIYDLRNIANDMELEIYLVGGYVRDKLMSAQAEPEDADFVIKGNIHKFMTEMSKIDYKFFPIKEDAGIYRCILDKNTIDISSMKGNSIEEDLGTRDFTINAIAMRVINDKIFDPFYGRRALKSRILKSVNEKSLEKDPVRILRGIRFYIKCGMHFNLETEKQIEKISNKVMEASKERIFRELMLIIKEDQSGSAFEIMDDYGILKNIMPYIDELKTIGKCKYHVEDVFTHMNLTYGVFKDILKGKMNLKGLDLSVFEVKIGEFELSEYLGLACFMHDIGKYEAYKKENNKISFHGHDIKGAEICKNFCNNLKFPKKAENYIENIVRGHMYPLGLFKNGSLNNRKAVYKFFYRYDGYVIGILVTAFCDNYATRMNLDRENEKERFKAFIERMLKEYKLYCEIRENRFLNGKDVMKILGKRGPVIKDILEDINKLRYLGRINSREEAIDYLKSQSF